MSDPVAAGVQIMTYVDKLLTDAGVASRIDLNDPGPQQRGVATRVNTRYVSDDPFEEYSSMSAEGRALELDLYVGVKRTEDGTDDDTAAKAKNIAAAIEKALAGARGWHQLGTGRFRAERVTDVVDEFSEELEEDVVLLMVSYSFLHRIPRGDPHTLL